MLHQILIVESIKIPYLKYQKQVGAHVDESWCPHGRWAPLNDISEFTIIYKLLQQTTVYVLNKAHALINMHPFFQPIDKLFSADLQKVLPSLLLINSTKVHTTPLQTNKLFCQDIITLHWFIKGHKTHEEYWIFPCQQKSADCCFKRILNNVHLENLALHVPYSRHVRYDNY